MDEDYKEQEHYDRDSECPYKGTKSPLMRGCYSCGGLDEDCYIYRDFLDEIRKEKKTGMEV